MTENQIIKSEEVQENSILATGTTTSYCSLKPKNIEERKKLFNSLENCDVILNDIVGKTIKLKDVFIQAYPRVDKDTGEKMSDGHRTILFDEDGMSYVTASNYFFVSLAKLFNTIGTPDEWEGSIEIEITKRDLKNGNKALSFKLV